MKNKKNYYQCLFSSSLHGLCSDWLRFVLPGETDALPFSHKSSLFDVAVVTVGSKGDSSDSESSLIEERLCKSWREGQRRERESVCVCVII